MKFKKLTLAAAISLGLASVATVGAFADGTLQNIAACPMNCQPACPLETPCCPPLEEPCGCQPVDPCCDPCPALPICPPCDKPACGTCPNVCDHVNKNGVMNYAYPENIFSGNRTFKADPYNIGFAKNDGVAVSKGSLCGCGAPILSNDCECGLPLFNSCGCGAPVINGCGCGQTGAAMPILYDYRNNMSNLCPSDNICGSPVDRNCNKMDNMACPIQIQTRTSMQAKNLKLTPFEVPVTGAATPISVASVFRDVPDGFWANCDINKLTAKKVIAGYPDRTFKPTLPVTRAEFASLIANGLNLCQCQEYCNEMFKDVSSHNWANNSIQRAVKSGYMAGYPDKTFQPKMPVTRAEALCTIAKAFNCNLTDCEAQQILSQYKDGCKVPAWGKNQIAKALKSGILEGTLTPDMIRPCENASRADVAAMLADARVALNIDCASEKTGCACDCPTKAFAESEECVDIPTLSIKMADKLSAMTSHVGDRFAAKTTDPIVINGVTYPACSMVHGVVTDVQRPSTKCSGALKVALVDIQNGKCKTKLPRQVLNAQVEKEKQSNWVARLFETPFTWTGRTLGTVGRTVGGIIVNAGNAVEEVTNGVGVGTGEIMSGKLGAAGRSYTDSLGALVMAPVDVVRTSLSGAAGVLQVTNDQIGYLVNPNGKTISSINPNEKVKFAFGTIDSSTGCACPAPCEPCAPSCGCEPAPAPCCEPCNPCNQPKCDCCD